MTEIPLQLLWPRGASSGARATARAPPCECEKEPHNGMTIASYCKPLSEGCFHSAVAGSAQRTDALLGNSEGRRLD